MEEMHYSRQDKKDVRFFLMGFSVVLTIVGILLFIPTFKNVSWGAWGDLVGGLIGTIFSLVGVLLLYLNLKEQRDVFARERFEIRFFEMINIHRENVSQISYNIKDEKGDNFINDRRFFNRIYKDFSILYEEMSFLFEGIEVSDIYEADYLEKVKNNSTIKERAIELLSYAKIDILYVVLFFGVARDGMPAIRHTFNGRYLPAFLDRVIKWARLKPVESSRYFYLWEKLMTLEPHQRKFVFEKWRRIKYENEKYSTRELYGDDNSYYLDYEKLFKKTVNKYYGGHQFRLGHYFRHLYQTVKYVNDNNDLDYHEKYENVKFLRAQLSTYEQIAIFLNSLSILGRVWEIEDRKTGKEILYDHQLITKYNLIKNISNNYIIRKIPATAFYPLVDFESINNDISLREELRKKYT